MTKQHPVAEIGGLDEMHPEHAGLLALEDLGPPVDPLDDQILPAVSLGFLDDCRSPMGVVASGVN